MLRERTFLQGWRDLLESLLTRIIHEPAETLSSLEVSLTLECLHLLTVYSMEFSGEGGAVHCRPGVAGAWARRLNQPLWRVHVARASQLSKQDRGL